MLKSYKIIGMFCNVYFVSFRDTTCL